MEALVEYLLSLIDYTYLLYFYSKLSGMKFELRKCIPWLPFIALIQFLSEFIDLPTLLTSMKDLLLISLFLLIYSKDFTKKNILHALTINILFILCINIGVSCLSVFNITTRSVLGFGVMRIVFALTLKVFTCIVMYFIVNYLVRLKLLVDSKINSLITLCLVFLALAFSFILQLSESDMNISIFTLILIAITSILFYLFAQYSILIQKKTDYEMTQNIMEMTNQHTQELNKEYQEIRKIKHETKNQFLICRNLLEQQKYNELKEVMSTFTQVYDQLQTVALCRNIFIDTVLNQKITQFSNIKFHLQISLSNDFNMNSSDIISLLSNLIDNACEELNRINEFEFTLTINGNASELSIYEQNACSKEAGLISKKTGKGHGYGLKIINDIVEKYDGEIIIEKTDYFKCTLILFF